MDGALPKNTGSKWVLLFGLGTQDASLYFPHFKIAHLDLIGSDFTIVDGATGAVLAYPPQNVIALVNGSGSTSDLAAWCVEARLDVPVVTHNPQLPEFLAALSGRLTEAAHWNAKLMLRLAELRTVHEEVQNSYNALRNYVYENGFAPPRIGFINVPDADGGVTLPDIVSEVAQPLPVELSSLCGFALYLPAPVRRFSEGRLHVELRVAEDDAVRYLWHVPYDKLTLGWITFAFEQTGQFWRRTPLLYLRFETVVGHSPLFSLGPPQLRPDKVAVINGVAGTRALAFKTWQSIPGAPLTVTNQMWPTIRLDRQVTQIELAINEDLNVVKVPGQEERTNFELVTLLADQRRLQVHPLEDMVSVAHLPLIVPAGASALVAEVETGNEKAGRIEYALAVMPAEDAGSISVAGELPPSAQLSDWVVLPPLTRGTVLLRLTRPVRETSDLLLLTRLAEGESSAYGWAQFLKVCFKGLFD